MHVDEGAGAQADVRGKQLGNLEFNMTTYMEKVRQQSLKSQNAQKLIPKSLKMTQYVQLPRADGISTIYVVREDGECQIDVFKLSQE